MSLEHQIPEKYLKSDTELEPDKVDHAQEKYNAGFARGMEVISSMQDGFPELETALQKVLEATQPNNSVRFKQALLELQEQLNALSVGDVHMSRDKAVLKYRAQAAIDTILEQAGRIISALEVYKQQK